MKNVLLYLVLCSYLVSGILKRSSVESSLEIGKLMSILALTHSMVNVVQDHLAGRQCNLQPTALFWVRCQVFNTTQQSRDITEWSIIHSKFHPPLHNPRWLLDCIRSWAKFGWNSCSSFSSYAISVTLTCATPCCKLLNSQQVSHISLITQQHKL